MPRGRWRTISIREDLFNKLSELAYRENKSISDVIEELLDTKVSKPVHCLEGFRCIGKRMGSMVIVECVNESGGVRQAVIPLKAIDKFVERLGEAIIIE
jgi:predicted CopG family antitoxin